MSSLQSVKWQLQEAAWYQVRFTIILIQRLDRHRSPLRFSQRQIRQLKHKCSNPRSRHKHQRQGNLKVKIRPKAHKLLNLHQILLQQAILQMTASRLSFRGRNETGGQWPPYFSLSYITFLHHLLIFIHLSICILQQFFCILVRIITPCISHRC